MLKKLSTILLIASSVAAAGLFAWKVTQWQAFADTPPEEAALAMVFAQDAFIAAAIFLAAFLGWLLSFNVRLLRRPFFLLSTAAIFTGALIGLVLREWPLVLELVPADAGEDYPKLDLVAWGLVAAGALVMLALVHGFEFANRKLWPKLARNFDRRGVSSGAMFCNWMSLLFRPGQSGMLRSVALARFRKGNRGESVEVLQNLYAEGKADSDVLEALCKYASEEKDSERYLKYLRELHRQVPDEAQIRDVLLDELVEQRHHKEALELIEESGAPESVEGLERYASVLLAEGQLEKATVVAGNLGAAEGIPFRRSQALLRDLLSRMNEYVPAINILASQAERMALRDQRIRWLEKSLEADPRQREVREQLIGIYRDLNQTVRLEMLLADVVRENPEDADLNFEFVQILHGNDKTAEAMERLEKLASLRNAPAKVFLFGARVHLEEKDWEKAREMAEQARERNPNEEEKRRINDLLVKVEEAVLTEEVAHLLERARENPEDVAVQMEALERLIEGGHAQKVLALVDQILDRHPGTRREVISHLERYGEREDVPFAILNLLGDLLAKEGRFEETLECVKQMADRSMDRVATMRDGVQKVLRMAPHHLSTLRLLGDTYLEAGHFTEMIHSYSLYLSNGGEETEQIDRALAKAYITLRDYENAKRFVTQLLVSGGDESKLLKQVIPLALEGGEPEDAAEYLKKLELLDARDPDLKNLKPRVEMALGERRFSFLKRELEAGKGDTEILEQLGDIARDLANYGEAITYYQRASRARDNESLARRCTAKLAYCYMKKRLDDLCTETLKGITISLEDDPKDLSSIMDILYEIGEMMLEVKMYDKAERVFKQLCRIDAGYRDVLERIESLRR